MKNIRQLFLSIFLICSICSLKAQDARFGASLNFGVSKIVFNELPFYVEESRHAWSGNAGLFFEKKIHTHYSLGFEILWVQIEGMEKERFSFSGPMYGFSVYEYKLHHSYLGLPTYIRFEKHKIAFRVGIQPMLFLSANLNILQYGTNASIPFTRVSEAKNIKLKKFDIGPKIGLDINLNKETRLKVDVFSGLIKTKNYGEVKKNFQATFGINYIFNIKNKED